MHNLRDADKIIPSCVGEFSRWFINHAHLLMAINLVSALKFK